MVHHTICITVHNLQDTMNDNSLPCACRKSFKYFWICAFGSWSFVVSALSEYRFFLYLFLSPIKFLSDPKILVFKIYFSRFFCKSFTIRLIIQSKSLFCYLSVRTFHSFALIEKDGVWNWHQIVQEEQKRALIDYTYFVDKYIYRFSKYFFFGMSCLLRDLKQTCYYRSMLFADAIILQNI